MSLINRAYELLAENKLREAEFMFKSILQQNKTLGPALMGLGEICMRLENHDNAVYYYKKACESLPKQTEPLFCLAKAFKSVGSPVDAKTVLEYAIKVSEHDPHVYYELGCFYLEHGYVTNAVKTFKRGLSCKVAPVSVYLMYEYSQIAHTSALPELLPATKQLHDLYTDSDSRTVALYTLAKSYHRLNDFSNAFEYFKQANATQLSRCKFGTEQMLPLFERIKNVCNEGYFRNRIDKVAMTFLPVFILGLPRTGSTLLEQMLTQHNNVASLGENTVLSSKIVPYLNKRFESQFPECLAQLSTSALNHGRTLYIEEVKKHRINKKIVINKLPANFQNIGLIYKLFPQARIIHLTRDFPANAWSVFSSHFGADEPYFCSLEEYKMYADAQSTIMTHFKKYITKNIASLSYENLLTQPEKELHTLFKFLNEQFHPQCLEYYKSNQPVSTLSKAQVRQPLSKAPLSGWLNYKSYMEKIIKL